MYEFEDDCEVTFSFLSFEVNGIRTLNPCNDFNQDSLGTVLYTQAETLGELRNQSLSEWCFITIGSQSNSIMKNISRIPGKNVTLNKSTPSFSDKSFAILSNLLVLYGFMLTNI